MTNKKIIWILRLSLLTAIFAWLVIGLGAFTRLTDAGLGCPDWPGCYGHIGVPGMLTPLSMLKAWTEMIHRYFAGTLAVGVMVIGVLCVMSAVQYGRTYLLCALLIFILVLYQAILGMLTVTLKLWPIVVSQHLLGGMCLLALLWFIYLKSRLQQSCISKHVGVLRDGRYAASSGRTEKSIAFIGLLLVFLQIALGAWTSTNYAALACPHFPFCHIGKQHFDFIHAFNLFSPIGINYEGGVLSDDARQTIQMTHRMVAVIVTLYLLWMTRYFWITQKENFYLRRVLIITLCILSLQLTLGILNVLFQLPLVTAVMHTLVGALLLCAVITVLYARGLNDSVRLCDNKV